MRDLTPMCAGSRIFSRRKNIGLKAEFSRTVPAMQRKSQNQKLRTIVTFTSLFPVFTRFGRSCLSHNVRLLLVSAKPAFRTLSDFYSFAPNSPFAHCQTFTRFGQIHPCTHVRLSLVSAKPASRALSDFYSFPPNAAPRTASDFYFFLKNKNESFRNLASLHGMMRIKQAGIFPGARR